MAKGNSIRINNQTTENLIKYLQTFPPDASVVLVLDDGKGNYHKWDCQIAVNFKHQEKTNTVQLIQGISKD